jgi:hypothetical protein
MPGWWSCCAASLPGSCTLEHHGTAMRMANCNVSGMPPFRVGCNRTADLACAERWDAWDPSSAISTNSLCLQLCLDSC